MASKTKFNINDHVIITYKSKYDKLLDSYESGYITEIIESGKEYKVKLYNGEIYPGEQKVIRLSREVKMEKNGTMTKVHRRFKCKCCTYIKDENPFLIYKTLNGAIGIPETSESLTHVTKDHIGVLEFIGLIIDEE